MSEHQFPTTRKIMYVSSMCGYPVCKRLPDDYSISDDADEWVEVLPADHKDEYEMYRQRMLAAVKRFGGSTDETVKIETIKNGEIAVHSIADVLVNLLYTLEGDSRYHMVRPMMEEIRNHLRDHTHKMFTFDLYAGRRFGENTLDSRQLAHWIYSYSTNSLLEEEKESSWYKKIISTFINELEKPPVLLNHRKYTIEDLDQMICALDIPSIGWTSRPYKPARVQPRVQASDAAHEDILDALVAFIIEGHKLYKVGTRTIVRHDTMVRLLHHIERIEGGEFVDRAVCRYRALCEDTTLLGHRSPIQARIHAILGVGSE